MTDQERICWTVGPIEFCANTYGEQEWLVYGMIGDTEIMPEQYWRGMLEDVVDHTLIWADKYADDLKDAVQFFEWRGR